LALEAFFLDALFFSATPGAAELDLDLDLDLDLFAAPDSFSLRSTSRRYFKSSSLIVPDKNNKKQEKLHIYTTNANLTKKKCCKY
jgi:hypothetical protein